jgi:hypothetical protein
MAIPLVTPGDLITADLINQLIQAVNQGAGVPSTGNINVPALIGMKLSAARTILITPSTQLNLGFVIDAGGNSVDLSSPPNLDRIVINQVPPGGAKVNAGLAVNLVVSGGNGASQPQPLPPKITGFNPLKVPVGTEVQILGESFALSRFDDHVSFNNFDAAAPSGASGPTSIFVVVPSNFPNPPVGNNELKVDVKITTPAGTVTSQQELVLLAPLPGPALAITGVIPAILTTGADVTISGTGFNATLNQNAIDFSTTTSPVVTVQPKSAPIAGQLVVTVPANIVGLTQGGTFGNVNIVVRTGGKKSPAFNAPIQVP